MATFFSSPSFLSHPITRRNFFSSSQPPIPPPSKPPAPTQLSSVEPSPPPPPAPSAAAKAAEPKPAVRTTAESTDWIASALTRRFGIGAGLAWVAFLAVGVVSEQIKTRLEVSREESGTRDVEKEEEVVLPNGIRDVEKEEEVVLPNGIRYYDMRVGGGASPRPGDLVVINVRGSVEGGGEAFVDTFKKRAVALVLGSRPYGRGICEGLEYVLRNMKAGGKRRVLIPPKFCFGEEGADLGEGLQIPPSSTLEYVIELEKVSIAPA